MLSRSFCLACRSRSFSTSNIFFKKATCKVPPTAVVLGLVTVEGDPEGVESELTPTGQKLDDSLDGKILEVLRDGAQPVPKLGEVRTLFHLDDIYKLIIIAGLGSSCLGYNEVELIDERKEAVRIATAAGARTCQEYNYQFVYIDTMEHAESAAEGAALGLWMYQDLRNPSLHKSIPRLEIFDSTDQAGWMIGLHKASAQNLARFLTESPGNQLTPSLFTQTAVEVLSKCGVNVNVRMKHWAKLRNLNGFVAVSKGSCEEPVLLEALYEGCDPDICPIVIIGKGTTFDAGGLCLKSCDEMQTAKGDMSGAAVVIATLKGIASLQLPINVRALIPLCENLPGATAIHPGSVVLSVANKSILINSTDDEGVLILADALSYANEFNPKLVVDVGNFTWQTTSALGSSATAVFSNSDSLFETMRIASMHTGDRIWRFPLWQYFNEYVKNTKYADLQNLKTHYDGGGVCKAAAFLYNFLNSKTDWIHLDTNGVNHTSGRAFTYLREGMSGRPTRTLIEFFAQLACVNQKQEKSAKC